MKYMLLIYTREDVWSEGEREQCMADSTELCHELAAKGQYLGANPLHSVTSATSVQVRDGKRLVTDGPFAETREQLGGYFVVEAKDLNEAISHLETAMQLKPQFSMDALDVMYSYQRLREVRLYALNFRSFRLFEKARRTFSKHTDRNLTSVISGPLTTDMLENPDDYVLPERQ